MTRLEKRIRQLKARSANYKWNDLVAIFKAFGYKELPCNSGGSGVKLHNEETGALFNLHRSHPENTVKKPYQKEALEHLMEFGHIDG